MSPFVLQVGALGVDATRLRVDLSKVAGAWINGSLHVVDRVSRSHLYSELGVTRYGLSIR